MWIKKKTSGSENEQTPPSSIINTDSAHGQPSANHDESNWLVSYADMMTLLCGFFIMLFSMAKLDTPKYDSFKEAVVKQFGGEYVSPTKELAKFATQVIQEMGLETPAIIRTDGFGISIVFHSTLFFGTLSADVTPNGRKILQTLIQNVALRQTQTGKKFHIVVEGHTDGRPVLSGPYPSNWELSAARASRVLRMFLDAKFLPDQLTGIGYGDTRPEIPARDSNGHWDESALLKNRRVVIRILEPNADGIPMAESAKTTD